MLAPENTLAAFACGARHGFVAFECDVKLSADGVPFLLHDDTLERTTTGRGGASRYRWDELARLDAGGWHDHAYADEPLPMLAAVAGYCLTNGFALNVEIKPSAGEDAATGRAVADDIDRLWIGDPPPPLLLSSFSATALAAARDAAARWPRALLLDRLDRGWLDTARSLACVAVVFRHPLIDEAVMAQVHGAGLRALAYTVNDAAHAERLLSLGVDSLITDAVDQVWVDAVPLTAFLAAIQSPNR